MERAFRHAFAYALTVVALSALQAASGAQSPPVWELAPPNPRFVESQRLPSAHLSLAPSPADYTHADGVPVLQSGLRRAPLPVRYDLRALGRTTSARQQDACGACWVFASYAALEGALLPGEQWDFSENHVKNTFGFAGDPCIGGNQHKVLAYLARWAGPVTEADDPYVPTVGTSPAGLAVRKHLQNVLFLPNRTGPLDTAAIKQAVMNVGPVYCAMTWSYSQMNFATDAFYYSGSRIDNHAVAIVGWDDNFDASRFLRRPAGPGAWICKNSVGTYFGDNGYFYVSYYDSGFAYEVTVFCKPESTSNYSRNYQYDPLGDTGYIGSGSNTAFYSNVFTAEATEPVAAAAFYAASPNTSYTVRLYTDVGDTPTSGKLASSASGVTVTPGYFTVSIPPVTVFEGSRFAVSVEVTTPTTVKPIPVEYYIYGYSHCSANPGESWVSADGVSWRDMATVIRHANVCVKAFTSGAKPTSLSVGDASGSAGQNLTLSAKLVLSADLAALAGEAVHFAVEGQDLGSATTSASGVASMPYTIPTTLGAGPHPLTCRFDGGGDLGGSRAVGTIVVARAGLSIGMQSAGGVPAQSIALSAVLRYAVGDAPAAALAVAFAVAGTSVGSSTTDATGTASVSYTIPVEAVEGSLPITAAFAGDAQRSPVSCSATLMVAKGGSSVTVSAAQGYVGHTLTLRATALRSIDGRPLTGSALAFTVDGVAAGTSVLDATGTAQVAYTPAEALRGRSVSVAAAFAGGPGQLPATGSATLTVAAYDTTLAVPDVTAVAGSVVRLSALLRRVGGGPVASATVVLSVVGVKVGEAPTDADGTAVVDYTLPAAFTSGSLAIGASFAGLADEGPSTGSGSVSIGGLATAVTVGSRSAQYGQTISLSGVLTAAADGTALRGRTVAVSLDGSALGVGTTDSTGAGGVRWTVPSAVAVGAHTVSVSFAGDAAYSPSDGTGSLTVAVADSLLSVAAVTATPGQRVNLTALLRHGITLAGQPGKPITFKLDATGLGSEPTDETGTATLPVTLPQDIPAGAHAVTAAFAGDAWLGGRTASSALTVLGQAPTSLSMQARSGEPGATVSLDAQLVLSSDSHALPGMAVAFGVDGTSVGGALTNSTGHAVLAYTIPSSAAVGSLATSAEFAAAAAYQASVASSVISVLRFATTLTVPNVAARTGQPVVLRAILCRSASGVALAGATVALSVDGSALGAVVTSATGSGELAYTPPTTMTGGAHSIGAAFAGSAIDAPASASAILSLGLADVVYSLSAQSGAVIQTVALSSRLRRKSDMAAVAGLAVTVRIAGTAVGSATTGADGLAVVRWFIPAGTPAGPRSVVGEFGGDVTYGAASASASMTVLAQAPTYCWVAARSAAAGTTLTLAGYLYQIMPDGSLPPLGGKAVTWSVDGAHVSVCTSALDGRCLAAFAIPSAWAGGTKHTLRLEYASGADPAYSGSYGTAQLVAN